MTEYTKKQIRTLYRARLRIHNIAEKLDLTYYDVNLVIQNSKSCNTIRDKHGVLQRTCKICKAEKEITEYHKRGLSQKGVQQRATSCKYCINLAGRNNTIMFTRTEKEKEQARTIARRSWDKHKDKINSKRRVSSLTEKELNKRRKYGREYYLIRKVRWLKEIYKTESNN